MGSNQTIEENKDVDQNIFSQFLNLYDKSTTNISNQWISVKEHIIDLILPT